MSVETITIDAAANFRAGEAITIRNNRPLSDPTTLNLALTGGDKFGHSGVTGDLPPNSAIVLISDGVSVWRGVSASAAALPDVYDLTAPQQASGVATLLNIQRNASLGTSVSAHFTLAGNVLTAARPLFLTVTAQVYWTATLNNNDDAGFVLSLADQAASGSEIIGANIGGMFQSSRGGAFQLSDGTTWWVRMAEGQQIGLELIEQAGIVGTATIEALLLSFEVAA